MSEKDNKTLPATFEEMQLPDRLFSAIQAMGFTEPTEIQARAVPLIRSGADVIGRSQTGTGKTIAFAIPALERIDPEEESVQVIVLCPTRELAQQGCVEIKKLSRFMMHIYPVDVFGGAAMTRQIQRLKRANLVIGTPGRVMDHMRRRTLRLDQVKMVILDEADEMLSMGFREDMETILRETPATRQTVLFSATMPPEILRLTDEFLQDPQMIEVNAEQVTLKEIAQSYVEVPMGRKKDALCLLLRTRAPKRAIVFCNTKALVDEIATHLIQNGFSADGLHGDLLQSQRTKVMDAFRSGRTAVLVATDVAARGIDVRDVEYVFNYDVPQDTEYYVHRIGRTGRAGKTGEAITICSGRRQVQEIALLAQTVHAEIPRMQLPTMEEAVTSLAERAQNEVEAQLADGVPDEIYEWVRTMKQRGYTAEAVAAAALQMHYEMLVPHENEAFAKSGGAAGGYKRLWLNIGRSSRVAPSHLVAAIAERTGIPGCDIGKIEIYDDHAIVGIPSECAEVCVGQMGGCTVCGKPVLCELLDDEPPRGKKTEKNNRPEKTAAEKKKASAAQPKRTAKSNPPSKGRGAPRGKTDKHHTHGAKKGYRR